MLKFGDAAAYPVKKASGSAAKLYASIYTLFFDGSAFILSGEGGEYGTATAADVRSTKTIVTDAGLVSGSLVTRATSAITVTPTATTQIFLPGIYDGSITIKGVNVGPTFATGTVTVASSPVMTGFKHLDGSSYSASYYVFAVNGLDFAPKLIIAYSNDSTRMHIYTDYASLGYYNKAYITATLTTSSVTAQVREIQYVNTSAGTSITSTGWTLPIANYGTITWVAYEKFLY